MELHHQIQTNLEIELRVENPMNMEKVYLGMGSRIFMGFMGGYHFCSKQVRQ